jgi:hypothetical protein
MKYPLSLSYSVFPIHCYIVLLYGSLVFTNPITWIWKFAESIVAWLVANDCFNICLGVLHPYCSWLFSSLAKTKTIYKYRQASFELFSCYPFPYHASFFKNLWSESFDAVLLWLVMGNSWQMPIVLNIILRYFVVRNCL